MWRSGSRDGRHRDAERRDNEAGLARLLSGRRGSDPPDLTIALTWPDGVEVDEVAALYYPTVVFFDANGRWWEHTAHDQPVRLLEQPPPVPRFPPGRPAG